LYRRLENRHEAGRAGKADLGRASVIATRTMVDRRCRTSYAREVSEVCLFRTWP
jgi:hypothetical protein